MFLGPAQVESHQGLALGVLYSSAACPGSSVALGGAGPGRPHLNSGDKCEEPTSWGWREGQMRKWAASGLRLKLTVIISFNTTDLGDGNVIIPISEMREKN